MSKRSPHRPLLLALSAFALLVGFLRFTSQQPSVAPLLADTTSPDVSLSFSQIPATISDNESFTLKVSVKNTSGTPLANITVTFTAVVGITPIISTSNVSCTVDPDHENVAICTIPAIADGKSQDVSINFTLATCVKAAPFTMIADAQAPGATKATVKQEINRTCTEVATSSVSSNNCLLPSSNAPSHCVNFCRTGASSSACKNVCVFLPNTDFNLYLCGDSQKIKSFSCDVIPPSSLTTTYRGTCQYSCVAK